MKKKDIQIKTHRLIDITDIKIENKVQYIINKLENHNYEAYLVGGCVRDFLLGNPVNDYDITTSAFPDEIIEVFEGYKTIETGKKFGTVTLVLQDEYYEITSFRTDGTYLDGRRPSSVEFSRSLEEDLKRRDFTINAMAYNPSIGLVDLYGGLEDLKKGVIRAVGQADKRFSEDFLRMLRAVRFAHRLDFEIEPSTLDAIKSLASNIEKISKERINQEFTKIILADRPKNGIILLEKLGLLKYIINDLHKTKGFDQRSIHHQYDLFDHTMEVLNATPSNLDLRLASLFHDLGKLYTMFIGDDGQGHFYGHDKLSAEIAEKNLKELRYDNKTIERVSILIARHMEAMNPYTEKTVKRLVRKIGPDLAEKLFYLQKADILATNNEQFVDNIYRALEILKNIEENFQEEEKLNFNGHDLIELGYIPGKDFGHVMDYIKNLIYEGLLVNEKEEIKNFIIERTYKDEKNNTSRFMFRS